MSNLRINIRFLFWYLRVKEASWKTQIVFGNYAFKYWQQSLLKPIEIFQFDLFPKPKPPTEAE